VLIKATSFKFEGLFLFVDFVSPKERDKKKINKRRTRNRTESYSYSRALVEEGIHTPLTHNIINLFLLLFFFSLSLKPKTVQGQYLLQHLHRCMR